MEQPTNQMRYEQMRKFRRKIPKGYRTCHGCGGWGQIPVTEPEHYGDMVAPGGLKSRRVLIPAQTELQVCVICKGKGCIKFGSEFDLTNGKSVNKI